MFRRFLERQTIYDWYATNSQGGNNYNKVDPDATFAHMNDCHMRNAQSKPRYNVQISIGSECIVSAAIFQFENNRGQALVSLSNMTTDSDYESEEGHTYLQKQKTYIKP